ncbi:MAG: hypothetical protein KIS68_05230 [Bauldia sp.]|nr:hypothetical protein [Bauldia sp.]
MWKRAAILVGVLLVMAAASLYVQAALPGPTGPYSVGRTEFRFVDEARLEIATGDPLDVREVPVEVWYPAVAGTGRVAPYFPGLDAVRDGLRRSGEVASLELLGLPLIRSGEWLDAELAGNPDRFPLVLFSPGNGTNAEFYATIAGDLASHGFVVVAINHPYDIAAVALAGGEVAVFPRRSGPTRPEELEERVDVRAADILFVLDRLASLSAAGDALASRLDFGRVAALGHSIGGIAAAQACIRDVRFRACGNLDGIQAGGPFAVIDLLTGPDVPFLFMTKESGLAPGLVRLLEERYSATYAVLIDGARHDSFSDAAVLRPSLLPFRNAADRHLELIRQTTLAFLTAAFGGWRPALVDEDGLRVVVFAERSPP